MADSITCPACGAINPPRSRYCDQCSAPLGQLLNQAATPNPDQGAQARVEHASVPLPPQPQTNYEPVPQYADTTQAQYYQPAPEQPPIPVYPSAPPPTTQPPDPPPVQQRPASSGIPRWLGVLTGAAVLLFVFISVVFVASNFMRAPVIVISTPTPTPVVVEATATADLGVVVEEPTLEPTTEVVADTPTTEAVEPTATTEEVAPTEAPVVEEPTEIVAVEEPTAEPVLAEPEGRVIFEDDLNNGPALSGLEDQTRNTEFSRGFHSPGVYHFKLSKPDETRSVMLPRIGVRDFTMQVDAWDNSDTFAGNMAVGVIFRAYDKDSFYAVLIDPRNGAFTARKYEGNEPTIELIPWTSSPHVLTGTEINQIRIDANDETFDISLNGVTVGTFNDSSYGFGMLGLMTLNVDATTPHTHHDNIAIWSRDPEPEPEAPVVKEDPAGNMVLVTGGEFIMGSNQKADEWTHVVNINEFYLDQTEVTNAAYKLCVEAGGCTPQRQSSSETHPGYADQDQFSDFPVINVTWEQANTFCGWANKRLPNEAEWERAASWDSLKQLKYDFGWGNTFDPALLNSAESGIGDTSAVHIYGQEVNGTFDMSGNVWEWTSSLLRSYPYDPADGREEQTDPGDRVIRGGSWAQTQGKAHGSIRQAAAPTYADREIGFRCAANP